ncbi:hypothetical protein [Jannaschia sp. W003]|uniref:hypothetical protein n=1 Tax=Jannaschia sp. W003 TaxID=2867012 RepID=UPI0021A53E05|nr:hypothetical protein [Jannaschia sp. W003]UWQ23164.1 hypothetical protein K3554_16425 [Jannaschia sp. W003]
MAIVIRTVLAGAALAALAGCNDSDGGAGTPAAGGDDGLFGLGAFFQQAFNASLLDEPVDPEASALTVAPLAEPFDI